MIRFHNDYNHGAHPAILQALMDTNREGYDSYGSDEWCEKGAAAIKKYLGDVDVDVHFLLGGTQVNLTLITAALRPYQSVISADTGHINEHEAGAIEHTGHKILARPAVNGKLTAAALREEAEAYYAGGCPEYMTQPKLVYLSSPSEFGTIYSKKELTEIRQICSEYGMYLYLDGARMGYGLGSEANDVTLADLVRLTDAFYIGGTKCGALFGEALVIRHPSLREHFRSYMKQNGAVLAKGWLLGLQFYTLFQDGLYFRITKKADEAAMRIKAAFAEKGIAFCSDSFTNQQFVLLTDQQREKLSQTYIFQDEGAVNELHHRVRFCTGWSTTEEEVEALIRDIRSL